MIASILLVASILSAGSAEEPATPAASSLARLAWLQGCWEARFPAVTIEENWMAPRGDSMVGVSRTVREARLIEHELVILREAGGVFTYEAHPAGQPAATFTAAEVGDSSIVFRNPEHDYPQEVGYRRVGADSLVAWIDGQSQGKPRKIEFPYARVRCPGP
jgi:hypothetical protein